MHHRILKVLLLNLNILTTSSCYQSVKDKNFESNSSQKNNVIL